MPAFILDLDGTLYSGSMPIPHAADFVALLRRKGLPYVLATNNSSRTPDDVAAHLRGFGIDAGPGDVLTSAQAAARWLQARGGVSRVHCVGEAGLRLALSEAGFELDEDGLGADAVVQGIDREFTYGKLERAVHALRAGAAYVLTNPDRLLPKDGMLTPGAGSLGAALEAASGVSPVVIGKPSPILLGYAVDKLGLAPDDVWVVGDNAATDIAGGFRSGYRTALVLTGLATRDNYREQLAAAGVSADVVADDLAELARLLGL
ncbi:HAD-IIA family hydrolase [Paenibacillus chartarius]|uniref:Acid sugar phosphatase n=1 Tax=Paenibacillus chartarius TaxID=747481 RepID=A0ABV6DF27_9BACL